MADARTVVRTTGRRLERLHSGHVGDHITGLLAGVVTPAGLVWRG